MRMERTISMMMGPGSINHNNRKFIADNVDRDRVKDNVVLVNQNLKKVYHELFDEALKKYNDKQTRKDRKIKDYYDHVRHDKQLKQFYEVIVQVGNKDDMACGTEEGNLAKEILLYYMEDFQVRNPNLKVFNAVIHMDEATPHLHINFVPFSEDNKRGLEKQVSLKGALKAQGITGSGRRDTEWNRWIEKEKKACFISMARYGVEWNQLGTHKEHLSVLEYKKQERTKEVQQLEEKQEHLQENVEQVEKNIREGEREAENAWVEATEARKELADIREEIVSAKEEWQKVKDNIQEEKQTLQFEVEAIKQDKREHLESYHKMLVGFNEEKKKAEDELADIQSQKDILDSAIKYETEILAEKEEETKKAEQKLSLIKEMLNKYQDPGDRLDKMVELQIQVNKLLEENATLKQKLQQAYEFMKSKFLNGVNMFEEFARSIGAKVQGRWEERNKGAR